MSDDRPYAGSGDAWASGASALYDRLAAVFVESIPFTFAGGNALDVGAGTGAVSRRLRDLGASPCALDMSPDMLSHAGDAAVHAVAGDMLALPFHDGCFDAALCAFGISHVDAPDRALAEMARVVRPDGAVAAAVFAAQPSSPAKEAVDEVIARYGHEPPAWYIHLKTVTEPLSNTPDLLRSLAASAGLAGVDLVDTIVDPHLDTAEVVAYRLGLAHVAPFVAALPRRRRLALLHDAAAAVASRGQPVRPRVLMLSGVVPSATPVR